MWASTSFDGSNTLDFFEGWLTSLSYSFQLYFDFSGYTDGNGISIIIQL